MTQGWPQRHVPDDLVDSSLFMKQDFIRFHKLVDDVITHVLKLNRALLQVGGDKGRQAARWLDLLG